MITCIKVMKGVKMKTKKKKVETIEVDGKEYLLQFGKYSVIYYIVAFSAFAIGYVVMKSLVLYLLK